MSRARRRAAAWAAGAWAARAWAGAASIALVMAAGAVVMTAAAAEKPAGPMSAADERRAKDAYFRGNPWSPLRAFARYDFPARAAGAPDPSVVIGSAEDAGVRLEGPGIAPRHIKMTVLPPEKENGPWRFRVERLDPAAAVRIAGEEWPAAPAPAGGEARVIDEDTVVEAGPFALRPYVQAEAGIIIEFDRRRTEGEAFVPPEWFAVDPAWVFHAPLTRYENPERLSLLTSLGRRKEYLRVGYFEIAPPAGAGAGAGPAPVRVYAYRPTFVAQAEESLSILFTDATTGQESYAAGRYLDLAPPRDGVYTIDFNRAYNPLCAYTHVFNCPIPPRENALPVAVRAGEKTWPGRAHR